MGEWKECKLGDVINYKKGFAFKSTSYCDSGTLIVRVSDTTQDSIDITSCVHISDDEASNYEDYRLNQGDVIIATVGSWPDNPQSVVGKVVRVPKAANGALLNQNAVRIRSLETIMNQTFMYYLLKSNLFSSYIVNNAQGSANQASITLEDIFSFRFLLPDLSEQCHIVSILSSLDDKIDLLQRQNKTLEAMAETLFRQWFVEEADEGWEEKSIGYLFDITSGKGLKKEKLIDSGIYPVLGANGEIGRTDDYLYDESLLYTGRVGTLGNVFISHKKKVWLSDNTLVIRPFKFFYSTYFILKASHLEEYNVGSTQPLIRQSDVKAIEMLLPPEKVFYKFEEQANVYFTKIFHNQSQIRILEKLRDTLLPKLMSGEVRVNV